MNTMKRCTILGGSNGIGLAFLNELKEKYDNFTIFDIKEPQIKLNNLKYIKFDMSKDDPLEFKEIIDDSDILIITAGIGRVTPLEFLDIVEIEKTIKINFTTTIKVIKMFYDSLLHKTDRYCMVMGSLAGDLSSPLFSVYGATKAGINRFIESINIELEKYGSQNRITNIKPISFKGSSFNGEKTDLSLLECLAKECLNSMFSRQTVYIPNYESCKQIIERYNKNNHQFGLESFDYKIENNRLKTQKMYKVGYLSGTFDLFHVGHLNLLKKAKSKCDYLIVGVHRSGAWKGKETFIPYEERVSIVESICYVDEAHESFLEDSDAWDKYHYDYLFVGSDYKGTERFNKYEEYFKDKNVEVVYFPYTKGVSSTQLREGLKEKGLH